MAHTPHELAEEFPGRSDDIAALRESDAHFARLVDEYHEVNRSIHRVETQVEPVNDATESAMRRRRLALKDDIARALAAVGA